MSFFALLEISPIMMCALFFLISSTLLVKQPLEEIEAYRSWQQGVSSISSQEVFKESLYDMHGLSTQECMSFLLDMFKSKEATTLAFMHERSSMLSTTSSSSQMIFPLTMSLPWDMSYDDEVEEVEMSKHTEEEAIWSSS